MRHAVQLPHNDLGSLAPLWYSEQPTVKSESEWTYVHASEHRSMHASHTACLLSVYFLSFEKDVPRLTLQKQSDGLKEITRFGDPFVSVTKHRATLHMRQPCGIRCLFLFPLFSNEKAEEKHPTNFGYRMKSRL